MQRPRYGLRTLSSNTLFENWPEFHPARSVSESECKGTLMNRGFANFFAKKVKKSAFFVILGAKMMNYWNG